MSVKAATRRTPHVVDTTLAGRRKKHKGSYWLHTGEHQELHDRLCKKLVELAIKRDEWLHGKYRYWALFNAMNGMYYGKYNDGDGAKAAIKNNRIHGFDSLEKFKAFAKELGATEVMAYCNNSCAANLERAMNEATLMLEKHLLVGI